MGTDASLPAEVSVPHDGVMNDQVAGERAVTLTDAGRQALREHLGIAESALWPSAAA